MNHYPSSAELGPHGDASGDESNSWQSIDMSPGRSAMNGGSYNSPATPLSQGYIHVGSSPHSMHTVMSTGADMLTPALAQAMTMPVYDSFTAMQATNQLMQLDSFVGELPVPGPSILGGDDLAAFNNGYSSASMEAMVASVQSSISPMSDFVMPNMPHQQQPLPPTDIIPLIPDYGQELIPSEMLQYDVRSLNSTLGSSPDMHTPNSDSADFISEPEPATTRASARRISDSSPTHGVKGSRVGKKRKSPAAPTPAAKAQTKFVILTPNTMNPGEGQPIGFDCFEEMRQNQRGRKGPLNIETKEAALKVRRKGACFCCRSRKIKCDMERPCKNCKKLHETVPQLLCWQFEDFVVTLFPGFIRDHFKENALSSFYSTNIQDFTINGEARGLTVALTSGGNFRSQLVIDTNIFTPKDKDVLQHWHVHSSDCNVSMTLRSAVPIGVDPQNKAQVAELNKRVKEYLANLPREPYFAYQLTETMGHSDVSYYIICMVQRYAKASKSTLVHSALSLYGMQYVMSRQLSLSHESLDQLRQAGIPIARDAKWVTSRVLNRQIKKMIDDFMRAEMDAVFKQLGRSLKPKSRDEWAPCLAAFLVMCLFMEAVEVTLETYVMADLQIQVRTNAPPTGITRLQAYEASQEIEKKPFRQFVYQFHQIYQTYSKDASAIAFNPLMDYSADVFESLDRPTQEFVRDLRAFLDHKRASTAAPNELDLLAQGDDASPPSEASPFPRDVNVLYAGRLVSKFLLSFVNEDYILNSPPRVSEVR